MRENHMVGLVPVEETLDFALLRALGVKWVRLDCGFPYGEKPGELSEAFRRRLETVRRYAGEGFKVLGVSVLPGSYRFDAASGRIRWGTDLPGWMGAYDSDAFYQNLREACAETGRLTKGLVDYWQIANEPDAEMFTGPFRDDELVRFLVAAAEGILEGNPDAKNGLNPAAPRERSRWLVGETYQRENSPFHFLGLDCYFGSWQGGGPEDWVSYIETMHALVNRPIVINEWGYSSLQGTPVTNPIAPSREVREHSDGGYEICLTKQWVNRWGAGHSEETQAEYIRECLRIFAENPYVIGNFFFRWNDTERCWRCGQSGCPSECAWGIVDAHGKPKAGYYAMRQGIRDYFTQA